MNANFFHGLRVALILIALASPVAAQTAIPVPPVDSVGVPARIRCSSTPAIEAEHADKIIFRITGMLIAKSPSQQVALDLIPRNTPLDIKVLDDPTTVADLKGKVLTFLGAVDNAAARQAVTIIDVDYAIVCPVQIAP
jgi:hypothetical protein